MHDLRSALDALAGEGTPRGAAAVIEAARHSSAAAPAEHGSHRRPWRGAVLAGLGVLVVVGVVAVIATGDGRDHDRAKARATTFHDDRFGFTVTIPPGWEREPLPDASREDPSATTRPGDPSGRQILSIGFAHEEHPEVTVQLFNQLEPLQQRRQQLRDELARQPADSPRSAEIEKQLAALEGEEMTIRTSTDDLESIEAQRANLRQQLSAQLDAQTASLIQQQLDALNEAEAKLRSRPASQCSRLRTETGIHLLVVEGTLLFPPELRDAVPEPRPARFGPESGMGSLQDPNWPPCASRRQATRWTDGDRELSFVLFVDAGMPPERLDEAYAILNSLRFDG